MAAQIQLIQQKAEYFVSQVDKELSKYPQLVRLEQTVPVPKAYAAIGGFALFTLFVFFNIFAGFLTNLVGFVLPAYFSMKALESPQPQDDVQWLTYWVVFGFFNFIESFVDLMFPFYYTFKTFAIVWLMLPQTQGAKLIYHRALRPLLAQTGSRSAAAPAAPTAADVN
ncbi:related to yop1-ypt-interacting protein [Ceraceosorus bombacis]|uniref:Protein YOP1 n=1 Tax=Ceraceosorus bombacis TaxID=401625 RepID=A0A0P1BDW7_9BASI|nr:related to yop1-ypt-interacting protein [Ceraceosorus bombacis]